ncbi:MAG: cobalamin-binding protein [Candidatus Omnitrophica bacterium]|nr:cobalamin-binding protein [Candidatus Omnitrophota bacterium]
MAKKLIVILFTVVWLSKSIYAGEKIRIVSLTPSITEILFALGLDEEIVGVSSFCNYPKKTSNRPKVGSFSKPDVEKIISLKPDIVFCTDMEQKEVINQLGQLKLNVYISNPKNVEELFLSIREIGFLTNRTKKAETLINNMRKDINVIVEKTKNIPFDKRPKVFLILWDEPLMTAGYGSFIDELIYLAGGINIAHRLKRPYSYFSLERLIKEDPDCIIATHMGKNKIDFKKNFIWNTLKATRDNRIYTDIEPDILLRPGPRLTEAIFKIHKRLYPEE